MVGSHNSPCPKAMRPHNCNTAGNGNITTFISIPYCAKHNLPSPTDFPISCFLFSHTPRDAGHNSPSPKAMPIHYKYTAGINKLRLWASLVNPYCAKHDLPSPTDFQFPGSQFPTHRLRRISHSRFPIYSSRVSNMVSSGRGV